MVSPNYGHHDSMVLYPLYNPNFKHRTRTLLNYNKKHVSLLTVHNYEEKSNKYDKN